VLFEVRTSGGLIMTLLSKAALAAAFVTAAVLASPLNAFADVSIFLSNPANGGSFPSASGTTAGTNGSLIDFNGNLGSPLGRRRLALTVTANPTKPSSLVATQVVVFCSGGTQSASRPSGGPGWVTPSAATVTVTCPLFQTSQTGFFTVDAF
jgi:hypothetical protein